MNTMLIFGLALGIAAPALKDPPKTDPAIVGEWVPESLTVGGKGGKFAAGLTYEFTADGKWVTHRDWADAPITPPRDYKLNPAVDRRERRPGRGPVDGRHLQGGRRHVDALLRPSGRRGAAKGV
jgi:hypothetical protein